MRRRFHWDKKYLYWGITAFCVVAAAILFYMLLDKLPVFGKAIHRVLSILSPFIWGLVITYLLTPMMRTMEKAWFAPLGARLFRRNKKGGERFGRSMSVFMSILIFLAILTALVYLILPQLYRSIAMIVENSQTYMANLTAWAERLLEKTPEIEAYVTDVMGSANQRILDWLQSTVLPSLGSFVTNLTTGVVVVLKGLYNLIIGIIVSAYILGNLETFKAGCKRLLYSIFTVEAAEKLREGIAFTDRTFMGFITGKLLDSAIVGLICYIVCAIIDMPYALLVSVIVGVTNIIPFFGPLIGAVPSAIIILMVNPLKCLIFIIFVIVLQQVDGNIIGPKILGNTTGINGFWIMFSIILGAGLFSFWGMLLGVPVFVVIYTLLDKLISRKLQRSDLPTELDDYQNLDHIDPITREAVKRGAPRRTQTPPKPEEKPAAETVKE